MGIEIGIGAIIIGAAFSAASYTLNYALAGGSRPQTLDNARQVDSRVQNSKFGVMIPRPYGTVEYAGNVIWATDFLDTPNTIPGERSKRGGTPDRVEHVYSRSFGVLLGAVPPGGTVLGVSRIKFDDKTFYESGTLGPVITDKLQVMLGGDDQLPNTWYQADKGVGRVSAHRGYLTLWFHDIDCGPYGDRIPNVRAEVVQAVDPALSDVVTYECRVARLADADFDATELEDDAVGGYLVNQQGPVRASLEQLSAAFQFDGSEFDGKINFRKRPRAAVVTVPWADLGTTEGDDDGDDGEDAETASGEAEPMLGLRRKQSAELPSRFEVIYFDRLRDHEEGKQGYSRQNFTGGETASRGYNLVLSPQQASRLAKIHAVTAWAERTPGRAALPPEYFVYAAGDVLRVPTDETETEFVELRIEKMNFGAPGVVRVEGVEQFAEAYDQTGDGASEGEAPPEPPPVPVACQSRVWFDDRPPFRQPDVGTPGHYLGSWPSECDPDAGFWRGTSFLRDVDGEGDLRQHALVTEAATGGYATTALAAGSGVDTVNTVDIHLESGLAASITDDAFTKDETVNLFAVGGETLQARDVEDLGGNNYRLSHLRREMFDTSSAGHAVVEQVILLDHRVKRVTHNLKEVGQTFAFYPVSLGGKVEDTVPFDFTYGARGVEPGGDVPSQVQDDAVVSLNGQQVLQWSAPLSNTNTLRGYKITVYSDPAMTVPVAGFEEVEVSGNQFVVPGVEAVV